MLTDVTSTDKLERLRAAVNVLQVQNPKRDEVRSLCKIWGVQQMIKGVHRPPAEIVEDMKAKVIAASNELKLSLAEHAQIATDSAATDGAAQLAEPPQQKKRNFGSDSAPQPPTAKAKPTTRQQKRKQDSPAVVAEASDTSSAAQPSCPQSKTQRLTHFFQHKSGPVIEPEADDTNVALRQREMRQNIALRQREMRQLYSELQSYRDVNPNTPGIADLIEQCKDLRVLPCTKRTLESRSIKVLYNSACGGLRQRADDGETWLRQDYTSVSVHACDGLQESIARKFQTWETVDVANFPMLSDIESFFHSAELNSLPASSSTESPRSTYWMPESRQQLLTDMRQLDAAPTVPFGSPSRGIKFLGSNVFHSLKMLAQLEMPDVSLDQAPSLCRAKNLYEMVRETREAYKNANCDQSFTASDVQQVLHDFFASSFIAKKWLLQLLRIPVAQRQNAEHIHSTLGINAPLGPKGGGHHGGANPPCLGIMLGCTPHDYGENSWQRARFCNT